MASKVEVASSELGVLLWRAGPTGLFDGLAPGGDIADRLIASDEFAALWRHLAAHVRTPAAFLSGWRSGRLGGSAK